MKFSAGELVMKNGAGYNGPGKVIVAFLGYDDHARYVVEHQIAGGRGYFYHIYGESQLSAFPQKEPRID